MVEIMLWVLMVAICLPLVVMLYVFCYILIRTYLEDLRLQRKKGHE